MAAEFSYKMLCLAMIATAKILVLACEEEHHLISNAYRKRVP